MSVIEALRDDNFLEQVPRAGTNHPATLELLDRIGLYARIEPRGIIAPLFHYWDRREQKRIAEFDHAHAQGMDSQQGLECYLCATCDRAE